MNDDRVIQFPGTENKIPEKTPASPAKTKTSKKAAASSPEAAALPGLDAMDEDRRKALSVIMSGMPFVCVGIQPTDKGADFFTSLGGDTAELSKAQPHLASVIERLFKRKGLL